MSTASSDTHALHPAPLVDLRRGTLWMLQTRSGKRTAKAAVRIAADMVAEGIITDFGRTVLAGWQALQVDDDSATSELVRQTVLVDEGIRSGPAVYAAARDFWAELVTLHPASRRR